ncbi:MAG: integrase arm-type DNA-binding domain-containing protein [Desulfomonilia bacterium]
MTYWDTELKGFCIRVSQTAKTYYAKKRVMGKPQWVKIGEYGLLRPDQARKEALMILSATLPRVWM